MDIKDKIVKALFEELKPEYVRLEDDDGISGFVVSAQFEGMSSLDRQTRIDEILSKASLDRKENRRVLMIAALTPEEYEAVGARIPVRSVKEMAGGTVEVRVQGGFSDAEYVRGALNNQKGLQTTEPKPIGSVLGTLMSFRTKGTDANPVTREKVIRFLKKDNYIEVMPNA
jgi:acid stress-induced BolA-like protein IbaG/YrbA